MVGCGVIVGTGVSMVGKIAVGDTGVSVLVGSRVGVKVGGMGV